MTTQITIRDADSADLEMLTALIQGAYRGDSARGGWTHEADLLGGQRIDAEMLSRLLADPAADLLVAMTPAGAGAGEGAPAGCVHLKKQADGRVAIGLLTVRPDLQAQGLGRQLLCAAERRAAGTRGAAATVMFVIRQRAELIAYYERRGYRPTGETAPFPYGDARYGLPKRDDLAFVVLEKGV